LRSRSVSCASPFHRTAELRTLSAAPVNAYLVVCRPPGNAAHDNLICPGRCKSSSPLYPQKRTSTAQIGRAEPNVEVAQILERSSRPFCFKNALGVRGSAVSESQSSPTVAQDYQVVRSGSGSLAP